MNDERTILTSNQMIGELMIRLVLLGFLFGITYNILYSIIRVKFGEEINLISRL